MEPHTHTHTHTHTQTPQRYQHKYGYAPVHTDTMYPKGYVLNSSEISLGVCKQYAYKGIGRCTNFISIISTHTVCIKSRQQPSEFLSLSRLSVQFKTVSTRSSKPIGRFSEAGLLE